MDFKIENIQIETRIENTETNSAQLPKADFEVLDWKNIRVNFVLNEEVRKIIGGRRLQFRIRDKQRGTSDWYSLRKTFARIPEIISVKCNTPANKTCQIKGEGLEYISRISIDGGKTWYPQEPASLAVETTSDGQKIAMIPQFGNKNLLLIKLRDFSAGDGLLLSNFSSTNNLWGKK